MTGAAGGEDEVPIFGTIPVGSEQDKKAREALRRLAESGQGQDLGRSVEAVLSGRASLRDLFSTPELASRLTALNAQVQNEMRRMTPEQRDEMMKRFRPEADR